MSQCLTIEKYKPLSDNAVLTGEDMLTSVMAKSGSKGHFQRLWFNIVARSLVNTFVCCVCVGVVRKALREELQALVKITMCFL